MRRFYCAGQEADNFFVMGSCVFGNLPVFLFGVGKRVRAYMYMGLTLPPLSK